ncbi:MAG: TAT-variant-translocated molybdopterin oxidoreductase [Bacteroidia bacterium]|nr:TAT-variant-translocated molybdopterin oxidoreductase [Bacteroidia bacterium]
MKKPTYWRGLEELKQTPEFIQQATKEFPTDISLEDALSETSNESLGFAANRRDFLKVLGFGITAATLSACVEGPVKKAIPYVNKPDDIIPGVANWYASTSSNGTPVLVKTREGRPIKLEGNPDSPLTNGGLSALGQATLLNLYDMDRMKGPKKGANDADWDTVDKEIMQKLAQIQASAGMLRVVSNTILSPSLQKIISEFTGTFENGAYITYDPVSASALAKAHEITFGKRGVPSYKFGNADVVISFSCDFLGTWLSPVEFASQYVVKRNPDQPMSRHLQFESVLTLTGANADMRFPLNPSQEGVALLNLFNKVAQKLGKGVVPGVPEYNVALSGLDKAADDLVASQGKSLVVCGTNDVAIQVVVAAINNMLGNYGQTLDIDNPSLCKQGDDEALAQLAKELEGGQVKALIVIGANPAFNSAFTKVFSEAIPKLELSVSLAYKEDETSALCQYTCPDSHFLESWGDAQQASNHYSLIQPAIHPIYKTRQAAQSLMKWTGNQGTYLSYLQNFWKERFFDATTGDFRMFWNETLRKGVKILPVNAPSSTFVADETALGTYANALKEGFTENPAEGQFELAFYQKVAILDGVESGNNPWLQEMPDPITKATWDNYLTVPAGYAESQGLKNGDVMKVSFGGNELYMPVVIQYGQAKNTLGIALGYGSAKAGKTAKRANGEVISGRQVAGANVYPYTSLKNGAVSYSAGTVAIERTELKYQIAMTQLFNTLYDPAKGVQFGEDYDRTEHIIQETTYNDYKNPDGHYAKHLEEQEAHRKHLVTLWDSHFEDPETSRHIHWKMAIDLNKCTGCGACVVACQAENNIPVVGKKEILISRDMAWMRIDRYYSGNVDNPDVVFQPMLCQHCDNAPCETVCPVLATIHSKEGLNQMAYNRCVGTRYCANNCPYKVRRFNWHNFWKSERLFGDLYTHNELGRLVLNPDVTVRFRGVMEKCSFCVQRLQDGKLRAKVEANSTFAKPEDGSIKTACQQSCPTGAIVFGDFNDPNSEVSRLFRDKRAYAVLEDVKTLPSVNYMALVRNRTEEEAEFKAQERAEVRNYQS